MFEGENLNATSRIDKDTAAKLKTKWTNSNMNPRVRLLMKLGVPVVNKIINELEYGPAEKLPGSFHLTDMERYERALRDRGFFSLKKPVVETGVPCTDLVNKEDSENKEEHDDDMDFKMDGV